MRINSIEEGHSLAETNLPPALQLKELLASYPSLDAGNPSSWFVWSDDPAIPPKSYTLQVCHADMRYTQKGYDYLVTAVPRIDNVSLKYLRMITHGPFKAFSDLITLGKFKDQYYLQCSELKKWPAPVLFNFCVASRVPIEFQDQLDGWSNLIDEGYPEVLSFLMSHSVGGGVFKHNRYFPDHGHHWFDPSSDWKNIISGTPDLTGLNYRSFPTSVTPSNAIWGKSDDHAIISSFDNVKAAEYFGFKHPPPREKARKLDMSGVKWKDANWNPHLAGGAGGGAIPQAIFNQIHMQQAQNGAWAQVAQAIHDEMPAVVAQAIGQPIAPPIAQPVVDDDDFPEPDFDEWPDFHDEGDD